MDDTFLTQLEKPGWYVIPSHFSLNDLDRVNTQLLALRAQGHLLTADEVYGKNEREIRICHYRNCTLCQEKEKADGRQIPAV